MPPKKSDVPAVTPMVIESRIHVIRDVRVMLDSDLADLYGVPTHRLNEQVSRNRDRFPSDFAFQLTQQEVKNLISQNAISSSGHGGRRKLPWVFTEHGVAMLASVLNSPAAVKVNIEIIRAFIRLRKLLATPGELLVTVEELSKTVKDHDKQLKAISEWLRKMFAPPPPDNTPKRKMGFHPPEPPPQTQ